MGPNNQEPTGDTQASFEPVSTTTFTETSTPVESVSLDQPIASVQTQEVSQVIDSTPQPTIAPMGIDPSIPQQPLPMSPIVQPTEVQTTTEVTSTTSDQPIVPPPVLIVEPEKKGMSVMSMVLLIMALILIIALGYIAFIKLTTKVTPLPTPVPVVQVDPTYVPVATDMPVVDQATPTAIPATASPDVVTTVPSPSPSTAP